MSILYKEQKNIADISASTGFWTYSWLGSFALLIEYFTPYY
jgi:hypothetical protein